MLLIRRRNIILYSKNQSRRGWEMVTERLWWSCFHCSHYNLSWCL